MDDLKKVVLKHSIIHYLKYAEMDDEVYGLILDKNLKLALTENKRLKEENMRLKLDGMLEEQPTIDLEINGTKTALTKEELVQLVAKYKEKDLIEKKPREMGRNIFIPEDIIGITTDEINMNHFYAYYKDDFGQKYSKITSGGQDKYALYFDLFNLYMSSFNYAKDYFVLSNSLGESITVSLKTTFSNDFLKNFSKGKQHIRKV